MSDSHLRKRKTMIRDRVGCVRTSTYNLPGSEHVFGKPKQPDHEGAGELIGNWTTFNPSEVKKTKSLVLYQNILAVKNGAITSKAMRKFALEHPNIRVREQISDLSGRNDGDLEVPFGIKTQYADETVKSIIQAQYTDYWNDDADYPDVRIIERLSGFPLPKDTKASKLMRDARVRTKEEVMKEPFVMTRFKNIPGKVCSNNSVTKNNGEPPASYERKQV